MSEFRSVLANMVPEEFKPDFHELVTRLCAILKVYSSSDQVHVAHFKLLCLDTYSLILSKFNNQQTHWISITPTVLSLLAHVWELISNHGGRGLGEYSEQGLEHSHKFLRFYRQNFARKSSQKANLHDCLTRLWLRSDPCIRHAAPKPFCSRCFKDDHFTVSCPEKMSHAVCSTSHTLDEHFLNFVLITAEL